MKEKFGECNGPLIYQLQREISTVTQGNMTIAQYYTKFKKYWDELGCLTPIPKCTCGVAKFVSDNLDSNRLMQFLMGLSDMYDSIRGQILLMEPLPNVNRAYSMILGVEKQREINSPMLERKRTVPSLLKHNKTHMQEVEVLTTPKPEA